MAQLLGFQSISCLAVVVLAVSLATFSQAEEESTAADDSQAAEVVAEAEADDDSQSTGSQASDSESEDPAEPQQAVKSPFGEPEGAIRLLPQYNAWIDGKRRIVIMDGKVCLREGQLEMFICTKGTKEHESIISVDTKAYAIHAALQTLGATPGKPVQFAPEYVAATGDEIEIHLLWRDAQGEKHAVRGQEWVHDASTKKEMQYPWVFAGSGFIVDETDGTRYYQAEGGDFICVSNFPSAMLDLPIKSTDANQGLLFEAFTERIPPLGTPVRVVLRPKNADASKPATEKDSAADAIDAAADTDAE